MSRSYTLGALVGAVLLAAPLSAQKPAPKDTAKAGGMAGMDHSKMGGMDHAAMHEQMMKAKGDSAGASWKELDAYHALMMATWHPAKDRNDLAPLRAKATEMVAAARTVAGSRAPASCANAPAIAKAQQALPGATEQVARLAAGATPDADLKAALRRLHDQFEVLEEGCSMGMAPHKK